VIQQHPLGAFLIIGYAGVWASLLPAVVGDVPMGPLGALAALAGMAVPALMITALDEGRDGVLELLSRLLVWRVKARWYLWAATAVPAGVAALSAIAGDVTAVEFAAFWTSPGVGLTVELALALLTVHVLEEIAWSGFLQSRAQVALGPTKAAVLTGVAFTLFHTPTYFVAVDVSLLTVVNAALGALLVLPTAIAFRIWMGWLYNRANTSILIAAVGHMSFSMTSDYRLLPALLSPTAALWIPLTVFATLALFATIATARARARRQEPFWSEIPSSSRLMRRKHLNELRPLPLSMHQLETDHAAHQSN
jgi:membrane protease YdiL (CAAX protease family)